MKLSILILTHNRPKLFKRCLESTLFNIPPDVEIIVNNDSHDITEIKHKQVRYYYNNNYDLSKIYESLYLKAKYKKIMFLEDDDYLLPLFYKKIDLKYDLNYINFIPVDMKDLLLSKFKIETHNKLFQLSQIIINKELIDHIPLGNHLDNDWKLFQQVLKKCKTINIIKTPLFVQTVDGKDNISFKEYNKDERFKTV